MITLSDALLLAQAHVAQLNHEAPIHPHYQYGMSSPTKYAHCWYFDYLVQPRPGHAPGEPEAFAGAPGFVVVRFSGKLGPVSCHAMRALAVQSAIWQECELAAVRLLQQPLSLTTLRQHLPLLALPELVASKKELDLLGTAEPARKQALKTKLLRAAGFVDVS